MSYDTNITGEIEIDPPIEWKHIRESVFLPSNARTGSRHSGRDVMLRIEQETRETDEGTLTVNRAVAVIATYAGYSGYEGKMVEHLQELVDAFPEHEFRGRIDGFGEDRDDPDLWRIKVIDRKVTKFEPTILWERESE